MDSLDYAYWIVLSSVPMVAWLVLYALVSVRSRKGDIEMRVNRFAITGAFLALVSFATGWSAIESGYDWSATTQMVFFLLLTYPVAIITPLAGVGQAGVLLWVLAWVQEQDAAIGMWPGYVLAWISTAFMVAGMVWPSGMSRERARQDLSDRLLTMTVRRPSGQWMPGNRALAYVLSVVIIAAAGLSLVFGRGLDAPLLLVVCLAFVLYLLRVNPLAGVLAGSLPRVASAPPRTTGGSPMAWVAFLGASFAAAVVVIGVAASSFGSSGLSGEERTSVLVWGGALLAILAPSAVIAYRRAAEPSLPRSAVTATVVIFSVLMLMSAVSLYSSLVLFMSATELLFLAGLVLVGIPVLFLQGTGARGEAAG
ncbi:MAG: hypothetical protein AB1793_07700 [Candidatus Thermoplasmatota archaeon]